MTLQTKYIADNYQGKPYIAIQNIDCDLHLFRIDIINHLLNIIKCLRD